MGSFNKAAEELKTLVRAAYPIIYLISDEKELSTFQILLSMSRESKKKIYSWDVKNGLGVPIISEGSYEFKIKDEECIDPISAIDAIEDFPDHENIIYILSEFHHYLEDPRVQRRLRNFTETIASYKKRTIIMLSTKNDGMSSGKKIPPELENILTILEWPYPDQEDIKRVLTEKHIPNFNEKISELNLEPMNFNEEEEQELINACRGMTFSQIEHALSKSMVKQRKLVPKIIAEEKKQIIQKSGLCDYIEPSEQLSDIGGLERLKEWLRLRKRILSEEAFNFGCDHPKGILLLGPWGSGKSSAAKAIINEWNLPGIRIDASKIFNMYVGDSEQRIRSILNLAESISPSILWFDEVENLIPSDNDSETDGGTSSRVLGIISTWMSEHSGTVFCIFTANDITNRPPKLFRKGRLDEIFIVDLPVEQERREIFKIHLMKRLYKQKSISILDNINLDTLAKESHNFSGAEIASCVNDAIITCFNDGKRKIKTSDIVKSIKQTIPISCTMREEINRLRDIQKGKAVCASIYPPEEICDIKKFNTRIGSVIEI